MENQDVHTFDNGVQIYSRYLTHQLSRYEEINIHEPEEERWFLELLESATSNDAMIDVGAAIGYYCILARKLHPELKILAVEPLTEHLEYIDNNFGLNGLSMDGIEILPIAVGESDGTVPFVEHSFCSHLDTSQSPTIWKMKRGIKRTLVQALQAIGVLSKEKEYLDSAVLMKCTTMDRLCESISGNVTLAKVDVQGAEIEVLRGAAKSARDKKILNWIVGTHSPELHRECKSILSSYGYEFRFEEWEVEGQPDGIIVATLPQ